MSSKGCSSFLQDITREENMFFKACCCMLLQSVNLPKPLLKRYPGEFSYKQTEFVYCVSVRVHCVPNKHCNVFFKMFWNLLCLQQLTVSFFSSFSGTSLPFMTHNTFNSYLPLQSAEMCIPLSSWCAFCSCVVFSVHKTQTIQGLAPLVVKISTGSLFILDILCFVALSSSYVTTSNFNTAHLNSVKQKASDSY